MVDKGIGGHQGFDMIRVSRLPFSLALTVRVIDNARSTYALTIPDGHHRRRVGPRAPRTPSPPRFSCPYPIPARYLAKRLDCASRDHRPHRFPHGRAPIHGVPPSLVLLPTSTPDCHHSPYTARCEPRDMAGVGRAVETIGDRLLPSRGRGLGPVPDSQGVGGEPERGQPTVKCFGVDAALIQTVARSVGGSRMAGGVDLGPGGQHRGGSLACV